MMKLDTVTKLSVIAASVVIVGTPIFNPVFSYLNEVPANSPGRWAGTRFTCLIGRAVIYVEGWSWMDNVKYQCLS